MKKLLTACAALLFVVGTSYAQMCFDFDSYCDGLELYLQAGVISGTWQNTYCAGIDQEVHGFASGGVGYVAGTLGGDTYAFVIDTPFDATMIMYLGPAPDWTVWIDPLNYTNYPAPCLFSISNGSDAQSTVDASRITAQ